MQNPFSLLVYLPFFIEDCGCQGKHQHQAEEQPLHFVRQLLSCEDFFYKTLTIYQFLYPLCLFRKYILSLVTSSRRLCYNAFYILNSSIGSKSSVIILFGILSDETM